MYVHIYIYVYIFTNKACLWGSYLVVQRTTQMGSTNAPTSGFLGGEPESPSSSSSSSSTACPSPKGAPTRKAFLF